MNEFDEKRSLIVYFLKYYMNIKNAYIEKIDSDIFGIEYVDITVGNFRLRYTKEQFDSDSEEVNAMNIMRSYIHYCAKLCFG